MQALKVTIKTLRDAQGEQKIPDCSARLCVAESDPEDGTERANYDFIKPCVESFIIWVILLIFANNLSFVKSHEHRWRWYRERVFSR